MNELEKLAREFDSFFCGYYYLNGREVRAVTKSVEATKAWLFSEFAPRLLNMVHKEISDVELKEYGEFDIAIKQCQRIAKEGK